MWDGNLEFIMNWINVGVLIVQNYLFACLTVFSGKEIIFNIKRTTPPSIVKIKVKNTSAGLY
jgi:hypothetical protein